jgi:hypothetical protein
MTRTLRTIAHIYRQDPRDFWTCLAVVPAAVVFWTALFWIVAG